MDESLDSLLEELQKEQLVDEQQVKVEKVAKVPKEVVKVESKKVKVEKVKPEAMLVGPAGEDAENYRFNELVDDFDAVSNEILDKWREDRVQTQEVIDILLGQLRVDINVPRVVLESLVGALAVKTNASLTAARLLDSKVRLMQATKSKLVVNNINSQNTELTSILSEPFKGDLED